MSNLGIANKKLKQNIHDNLEDITEDQMKSII